MLTNFENITFELNEYELKKLVPVIVKGLRTKIGKENAVTSTHIVKALKMQGYKIDGARLRKIIQYIRITGLIERLMATSKGYYISNDKNELESYIESLLQRASQIELLAKQLEYQKKKI